MGTQRPFTLFTERKGWVKKSCKSCGKDFWVTPSAQFKRVRCSKSCAGNASMKGKYGENHVAFKQGWYISKRGYKMVLKSDNGIKRKTNATGGHYIPEHKVIAGQALGRDLNSSELVHHIDLDKLNNNNDNLLICNAPYHKWLHNRMGERYAEIYLQKGVA